MRVGEEYGENLVLVLLVQRVEINNGGELEEINVVAVVGKRAELVLVQHIMTVQNGVVGHFVRSEFSLIIGEDCTGEFVLLVKIVVEIILVIIALHNGVVDIRAVYGNPADEIVVRLIQSGVFLVYRTLGEIFKLLLGGSLVF